MHIAVDAVSMPGRVAHVHTYWLGIADTEQALIFRTVVLGTGTSLVWGWPTERAAVAGHRRVSRWLATGGPTPAGTISAVMPAHVRYVAASHVRRAPGRTT